MNFFQAKGYLICFDFKDGYYHIAIHPNFRKYLGFSVVLNDFLNMLYDILVQKYVCGTMFFNVARKFTFHQIDDFLAPNNITMIDGVMMLSKNCHLIYHLISSSSVN